MSKNRHLSFCYIVGFPPVFHILDETRVKGLCNVWCAVSYMFNSFRLGCVRRVLASPSNHLKVNIFIPYFETQTRHEFVKLSNFINAIFLKWIFFRKTPHGGYMIGSYISSPPPLPLQIGDHLDSYDRIGPQNLRSKHD